MMNPVIPDNLQLHADPLADGIVERIVGQGYAHPWSPDAPPWRRIAKANCLLAQWSDNASLADPCQPGSDSDEDREIASALNDYVQAARHLPGWADNDKIRKAENVFLDHSVLSCTLLFCASLPQCYVIPDLALVLHTAGQLEAHTEHRIRSTAAMIFPVMLPGGLTDAKGTGIVQILKVRLIHATIRHLILRGTPERAVAPGAAAIRPPLPLPENARGLHQTMYHRGWDVAGLGLPCNQEEQAYTLLTFSHVFLQGLHQLGVGLAPEDEDSYLHAWNVAGHVLGIQPTLMAHDMQQGQALFSSMQASGMNEPVQPDPRPALTEALMQTMGNAIPWPLIQPWPRLLTRRLCGAATARALSLNAQAPWYSRGLFWLALTLCRGIDALARLVWPRFSLSGAVTRVMGRQLMAQLLLNETRPLNLPEHLLHQIRISVSPEAPPSHVPGWLHAVERRLAPGRATAITGSPAT